MVETKKLEFGQLIEIILNFTGQKNYILAKHLGYDVSYISKWINGNKLPTLKNIRKINKNIADFLIKSINDSQLDEFISKYDIHVQSSEEKKSVVKEYVESKLGEAYSNSFDSKKSSKCENSNKNCIDEKLMNTSINSNITINPNFKKNNLPLVLKELYSKDHEVECIILSNIFSINRDDLMFTSGIKDNFFLSKYKHLHKANLLLSLDSYDDKDLLFNGIAFINMATLQSNVDFNFYSCDFPSHSSISAIKDTFMHSTLYNSDKKCIMTNTSIDKKVVSQTYEMLLDIQENKSLKIFDKKTSYDMINDNIIQQFLMSNSIKMLVGNINEIFMPNELLLSLGIKKLKCLENNEVKLKEIKSIIDNITFNLKSEILIYESCLEKYVVTGKVSFFNEILEVPLCERVSHLTYFKSIIENKENIKFGIIKGNFIDKFKNLNNPSLYLSSTLSFLKEENNEENNYLLIQDRNLKNFFEKFYYEITKDENNCIVYDKKEILAIIDKNLLHLNALASAQSSILK